MKLADNIIDTAVFSNCECICECICLMIAVDFFFFIKCTGGKYGSYVIVKGLYYFVSHVHWFFEIGALFHSNLLQNYCILLV